MLTMWHKGNHGFTSNYIRYSFPAFDGKQPRPLVTRNVKNLSMTLMDYLRGERFCFNLKVPVPSSSN